MSKMSFVKGGRVARLAIALAVAGTVTTVGVTLSGQTKIEIDGIRNFTKVDATIGCGGATEPEAMAALKEMGYVSVINFRLPEERGATNEAGMAAAEAAGLKYIHLPFTPAAEDAEATVDRFLTEVQNEDNLPAYIHCGSANRVGGLWMIKRILVDGWDRTRAQTEAEAIGLRSDPMREFVASYLESHAPQPH